MFEFEGRFEVIEGNLKDDGQEENGLSLSLDNRCELEGLMYGVKELKQSMQC